jgi:hypothetical protein
VANNEYEFSFSQPTHASSYTFAPKDIFSPCQENHELGDEVELADGRVSGHCVRCGVKVIGRRLVGGLGLARLKNALIDALGDGGALPGLADEIQRVEMMVEVEEASLEDARRLIERARRMLETLLVE